MNTHPVQTLDSVFRFLDGMIADYGLYLFMGFVHVAIPIVVWVLCGGLHRALFKGKSVPHLQPVIFIHLPGKPVPPPETFDPFPPLREDCPSCDVRHGD